MFKINSCISIVWDKDNFVYGAVFKVKLKKLHAVKFATSKDKSLSFHQRLSEVYIKLGGNSSDRVILGGYISDSLIFTVDTPSLKRQELKEYLDFEVSRYIPGNPGDFTWIYRPILYSESDRNKAEKVKIFAIKKSVYNDITMLIQESGIKYDALLYPFFVLEPLYSNSNFYLEAIDEDFYFKSSAGKDESFMLEIPEDDLGKRSIAEQTYDQFSSFKNIFNEDFKYFIPSIILAEYSLSPEFTLDSRNFFAVPKNSRPVRFKGLKFIAYASSALFVVLLGMILTMDAINNGRVIDKVDQEITSLKLELQKLKSAMTDEKINDQYIQLVFSSAPNDIDALDFLLYMSKLMPKNVWTDYLNTFGNNITLSLQAKGNTDNFINQLYQSTNYPLKTIRKNQSADGSIYIYMNLTGNTNSISSYQQSSGE